MIRRIVIGALAAAGVALFLAPAAGFAQIGACTVGGADCSLETRLSGKNLCTDGVDNDGNGLVDAADPHCAGEVLCQDTFDNDNDGLVDGADTDCICVTQANPSVTNCTANDIAISYTSNPTVSDGCINPNDTVVAQLTAQVTSSSPDRYDIGMWLALDGGSALNSNFCVRDILQPATVAAGTIGPFNNPYARLDADACGDSPKSSVSTYTMPFLVTVPCSDQIVSPTTGQNGWIDLGQCGSWDNNAATTCNNSTQALPGTAAKCRCERADSSIPGPNFALTCSSFSAGGVGPTLDVGETATFNVDYTNAVANCTSGTPAGGDPFGRARCGTASFLRVVVDYPATANADGIFYYTDVSSTDQVIPTCGVSEGVLASNLGVVCNDTTIKRLVFAPKDPNASFTYGVVSAFAGTRTLPFKYKLTSTPGSTFTFASHIYWDNLLDTAAPSGTITTDEAVNLTGAILQNCSECNCTTSASTTPVTLTSFRATPAGRGVEFEWTTETEVGNVGFNLYAVDKRSKQRLNSELIPATTSRSLEPQAYSIVLDNPSGAKHFQLEDVDLHGSGRWHGPFDLDKRYGAPSKPLDIDWSSIRREQGTSPEATGRVRFASSTRTRAGATTTVSIAPSLDLEVDATGLYRVTYENLLAAGFDLAAQSSAQLGLTQNGKPVPIYLSAGTKFGPGSYIEFWGEALDTLYTKTNVYRLLTGQKKPARAGSSAAIATGAAALAYPELRHFERNVDYAVWDSTNDPFFDTEMFVLGSPGDWPFSFVVDGYLPTAGAATLRVDLAGATALPAVAPDHHVRFLVNGVSVGDGAFDGPTALAFQATIPAGVLVNGNNTLTLRMLADTGAPFDIVDVDDYKITYPRAFAAKSGALDFHGAGSRFDLTGFDSADIVAYRRDLTGLTRLTGLQVSPDGSQFRATVPGSGGDADYSVARGAALRSPAAIVATREKRDITTGSASYLILTNGAFADGLSTLVAARTAEGFTVRVVDVDDVYSQFRGGVFDAEAIHDYISYAYKSMGTRYVLLVGGDSYDYLGYLATGSISFVPSLYRATGDIVHWAPVDSAYADVDGDGIQDLAIGRWPVRTADELAAVLDKTLQYSAKTYTRIGTFAADVADPTGSESFSSASDRLIDKLPKGWTASRAYLDSSTLAQARATLFAGIGAGSALTSYAGHSGISSWGTSFDPNFQLLRIADVDSLANGTRPTLISQLGCWNTYFASPTIDSLGSRLVLVSGKGAAAVLGASTLSEDAHGNLFGTLLTPLMTKSGQRVGDAVVEAKRAFARQVSPALDPRDVLLGWTLLGDPALRVTP